ncbi:uncharacterized protein J4E79_005281 [Alternaria viburni]|uniref:uncharacterized protein n=1 Tax=Alternaria viburni TaxID=566460 RepID=UPI0020C1D3DB|nr:uncharacterized protein J4E79_005281 [Alternaria viburni]KAI4660713.1 hypothetical protein J4E79_005281 [Alternaria viburni]
MEAIGLVASIITLVSAASHAASILERVLGLRGISLYVLGAINEVTDFKATLVLLQTTLEETQHQLPLDHRVEYDRLLDRSMGCINAFTKHLRKNVLREREKAACADKAMELKRPGAGFVENELRISDECDKLAGFARELWISYCHWAK